MIKNRKSAVAAMIITAVLWSSGGMLIKMANGSPLAIASGRAGLAALVIMFYTRFRFERISWNSAIGILTYSFTVIGFVIANKLTTSANAVLLQFTSPVWVALFSRFFLRIKICYSDILSIIILLGGMVLFFAGKLNSGMFLGNLVALLTGISFAGFIVSLKTVDKGKTIYPIMYGNILTFIVGLPFYSRELFLPHSITGLLLLGLFQVGLAYILYSQAIEYLSALDGIIIPILEPLLNPVWVALTVGEHPSRYAVLGGVIILITMIGRSIYQTKYHRVNA
ncbi:MAG: DMT family transporter [Bacillota bacterium]|nr:DMT family transporter [Bacillota bacterium]